MGILTYRGVKTILGRSIVYIGQLGRYIDTGCPKSPACWQVLGFWLRDYILSEARRSPPEDVLSGQPVCWAGGASHTGFSTSSTKDPPEEVVP